VATETGYLLKSSIHVDGCSHIEDVHGDMEPDIQIARSEPRMVGRAPDMALSPLTERPRLESRAGPPESLKTDLRSPSANSEVIGFINGLVIALPIDMVIGLIVKTPSPARPCVKLAFQTKDSLLKIPH